MAKQTLVINIQNVDTREQMNQEVKEALKDMENNNKHLGRKGDSTTDFTWKWVIAAQ